MLLSFFIFREIGTLIGCSSSLLFQQPYPITLQSRSRVISFATHRKTHNNLRILSNQVLFAILYPFTTVDVLFACIHSKSKKSSEILLFHDDREEGVIVSMRI